MTTVLSRITFAGVRKSAREAYRAKRLIAQHGQHFQHRKVIDGKDCRCAFGSHLPAEFITELEEKRLHGCSSLALAGYGLVKFTSAEDGNRVEALELAHDEWAGAVDPEHRKSAEARFCRLIGVTPGA